MLISSVAEHLAPQQSGYAMNSPLLFGLLDGYSEDTYYEILDVNPANQFQLDYFSRVHCKLYLPGSGQQLLAMNPDEYDTQTKINRALVKNLQLYKNKKTHLNLIMLWDLPNYLDTRLLNELVQFLMPHAQDDVMLHIYIQTRESMPGLPGHYTFQGDNKIWVENNSTNSIPCPMYYKDALQKILSPFVVQKGVLLSNGLQEYLLKRQ
ncbi:hypothetical protein MNBD_GAMMA21-1028 [hydrothermal vent metagenome]|uniref:Uncharacterized protein n=1 Tax=hydrothermal vent metagenome TaxID=652676 RepID=A0A3B0ZSF2_9ZZZZ